MEDNQATASNKQSTTPARGSASKEHSKAGSDEYSKGRTPNTDGRIHDSRQRSKLDAVEEDEDTVTQKNLPTDKNE